jgi:hypothetical protein
MPLELQTALISAAVAIFTAVLGGSFTWYQVQRERKKWLIDLKASYSVELYKTRLATYPQAYTIIAQASNRAKEAVTPEKARQIAQELNEWFYSTGGMCAEASTRGALLGLREALFSWGQGTQPPDFYDWRNTALLLLRRDLDIQGLESFDPKNRGPLLESLKAEIASLK